MIGPTDLNAHHHPNEFKAFAPQGPRTAYEVHVEHVCNDPEFAEEVNRAVPSRLAFLKKIMQEDDIGKKGDLTRELEKSINSDALQPIASNYRIRVHDVWMFVIGQHETMYFNRNKPWIYALEERNGVYMLYFDASITRDTFLMAWQDVMELKNKAFDSKIPQPKKPTDGDLIYAIFKARSRKTAWSDIFEQYQAGNLPYYAKEPNPKHYTSQDLQNYYYKYNPVKFTLS